MQQVTLAASTTRFIIYLRKSSESDEKQKSSIDDQERVLTDLARSKGLTIVGKPMREQRSAKFAGRPVFNSIIERIEAGEADGLLVFSLDRLARNSVDAGRVTSMLTSGRIKEVQTYTARFTSTGTDKLTMGMQFVLAEYYSDNLSEHITKSLAGRLAAGLWPNKPKLGYLRDHRTKVCVLDPDRAEFVRRIHHLYLQGTSFKEIERTAREVWGLKNPAYRKTGGTFLTSSQIYRILHDPFYAGYMRMKDQLYKGNHEALITWEEYQAIQRKLRGDDGAVARPKLYAYPYRGLLRCGDCGNSITAEKTINRYGKEYLYWHCARRSRVGRKCRQPSVENRDLEEQLVEFFSSFQLPADLVRWINEKVDGLEDQRLDVGQENQRRLKEQLAHLDQRMAGLRALCADGRITPDEFSRDREKYTTEQADLLSQLQRYEANGQPFEPFRSGLSALISAAESWSELDEEQKRRVLRQACSNPRLKDGMLLITAKEPFEMFRNIDTIPKVRRVWKHVRTFLTTNNLE